jgi:DHA2 family multidrug resistance protein
VPLGLFCLIALAGVLSESPTIRRSFDFFGFATLSIAVLSLQLMLDRGQVKDWFGSSEVLLEATCGGLAAYLFAVHCVTVREPFVNLHLFQDRNFSTGCGIGVVVGILMLGPLVLMTSLLQGLLQYPVITAGIITGSRAIGSVFASAILGKALRHIDPRIAIATGFAAAAIALTEMCRFNLQMSYDIVFWTGVLYGFGIGTASISMTTVTFSTLPMHLRTDGAAVSNLLRNIGGSIGIAVMQTMFIRSSAVMHARLAEHVTPYSNRLQPSMDVSNVARLAAMDGQIMQQAAMLAYNNMFRMMLIIAIFCIPLAFLFRKPPASKIATSSSTR